MTSDDAQPTHRRDPGTFTRLLDDARDGDQDALEAVWTEVYDELRIVANNLMRGNALATQLGATELIGEMWLRTKPDQELPTDRQQFFGRAIRLMSQVLIDRARRRNAAKRGGGWAKRPLDVIEGELSSVAGLGKEQGEAAVVIMEACQTLNQTFPEEATVAFCRLVLGLTNDQTAKTLERSPKTVEKQWYFARAKLRVALDKAGEAD